MQVKDKDSKGEAEECREEIMPADTEEVAKGDVDDDEVIESQEQDTEPVQILPTPELPSESEIAEHRVDHIPFRSWCKECLEGWGREDGHHACGGGSRSIPVISLDYMFLSRRGVFTRQEWQPLEGEQSLKILVVKDARSKAVFAHAVPQKGIDEKRFSVDQIVEDCRWMGYSRLILKSDNEKPIAKLVSEALKGLKVNGEVGQAIG